MSGLRRNDVKGDHIEVTTVKTADSLSIELNDVSKAILEKYNEVPFKDNYALPVYTNQAMNRNIKELCKLAGIDEEIRVTTYKAMKPYIDIVDSIKASEMTKLNGLL